MTLRRSRASKRNDRGVSSTELVWAYGAPCPRDGGVHEIRQDDLVEAQESRLSATAAV
jgi:hypothetical protein